MKSNRNAILFSQYPTLCPLDFKNKSIFEKRIPREIAPHKSCYPQFSAKIALSFARARLAREQNAVFRVPCPGVAGVRASEPGRASFAATPPEIIDGAPVVCRLCPTTFKCRRLRLQLLLIRPVVSSLRLCVRTRGRTCVRTCVRTPTSMRVRDARRPTPVGGAAKFRRIGLFFNASPPYPRSKPP